MCFAPQRRALFRHFFDIWTSKIGPNLVCFVHFDLEMCFAPQRRALFWHLNFQKWSEPGVFCTFWLGNVLRATTACTFLTSQLPKVVRTWCVLYILTWKCASRHNVLHHLEWTILSHSVYLSSHLSIYLIYPAGLSLSLSSNYLSIYYLSTYLSISLSLSSVYLSSCLPVYLCCSVIQCNVVWCSVS